MAAKALSVKITPPRQLIGEIAIPGDKSISHRALILNSIANGSSLVSNLAPGRDCLSTMSCLKSLGVKFTRKEDQPGWLTHGVGRTGLTEADNILSAGNSGTTTRLLGGLLVAQPFLSILTGDASLRSRPMKRLVEPLRLMGANIHGRGQDSFAPLVLMGKALHGINYDLPVPSAQIKSAILLAGLFASGDTMIRQGQPLRDHTERLLKLMGARLESHNLEVFLSPLSAPLTAIDVRVPGDISSAAYWLVAATIHPNARIKVLNCGVNPTRTGILDVLLAMGAHLKIENQRIEANEPVADILAESSRLRGTQVGGDIVPRLIDEIPVLAVAACVAQGTTVIRDAGELRVKESDRIASTAKELTRLGADIEELPDGMVIHGDRHLLGAETRSHSDHRLAMSLGVAGSVAEGETVIRGADAADISHPAFWEELRRLSKY